MRLVACLIAVLLLLPGTPVVAELGAQRAAFPEALRAAKRGDAAAVERHRERLQTYPLYPYLDYYLLGNRLERAPDDAVREFIATWPDLPVNERLRRDWLRALARRNRWETFIGDWHAPTDTTLRCNWITAHLRTGRAEAPEVAEEAVRLWLVGRSQPDACDPVFAWLQEAGLMDDGLIQQRMELALESRQFGLAGWLARRLDESDRDFVRRWQLMQQNPTRALATRNFPADSERERRLVTAGLERLVRTDPAAGRERLTVVEAHFDLDEPQRQQVLRAAAILAAQRHQTQAAEWLGEVAGTDLVVDEWRVRAALRHGNWHGARMAIAAMPAALQEQSVWRYWRARADERLGDEAAARVAYSDLAGGRGYHSWLAADRLGKPYALESSPDEANEALIDELAARSGFQRAREFLALGMQPEARAEWAAATAGLDNTELVQAALLAERWQWHPQAIATVNRTGQFDNLELRFPVLYAREILPQASEQNLDPALVYSLVRSESLFVSDARSGAGALGLMQLMPGTGRDVARRLGVRLSGNQALLDPETNVRLGSAYLATVLARFDRNEVLATAAYNAGPHRVQRWLPREGAMPADIWIETIPFNETRAYVRQVMGGTAIFDWRLGREVRPISTRLQDIPAEAE